MYQIFLTQTANKSQKKFDNELRLKIRDSLLLLAQDPENNGEHLCQPLESVYSHHIKYKGKEFRVGYTIDRENLEITVLLIAAHENFYKKLKLIKYNR
jgi:mRNA-degrading endonuclease RelE of RelBE toxin-antitoxin system